MDERFREDPYPFQAHLGMRVEDWGPDICRIALPVDDHLMNRHMNVHGGVYASLLDTCMGYAGCWTGDPERVQLCLTLSLTVQFISRPRGMLLTGIGRRTGGGKGTFFAEAEIGDETGELVAKGTGVFRYRRSA